MDPGLGKSLGEGNDNPLQFSCLEYFIDRGAWQATVHGVAKRLIISLSSSSYSADYLLISGETSGKTATCNGLVGRSYTQRISNI